MKETHPSYDNVCADSIIIRIFCADNKMSQLTNSYDTKLVPANSPSSASNRPSDVSPMPSWDDPDPSPNDPWFKALQCLDQPPVCPTQGLGGSSLHPYTERRAAVSDTEISGPTSTLSFESDLSPICFPPISPIPLPAAFRFARGVSTSKYPILRRKTSEIQKPSRKASAPSLIMRPAPQRLDKTETWARRLEASADRLDESTVNPKMHPATPPPSSVLNAEDHTYAFDSHYQNIGTTPLSSRFPQEHMYDMTPLSSPIVGNTRSSLIDHANSPRRHWSNDSFSSQYGIESSNQRISSWDPDLPSSSLGLSLAGAVDERCGIHNGLPLMSSTLYSGAPMHPLSLDTSPMNGNQCGMIFEVPPGTSVTLISPDGTVHSPRPSGTPTQLYIQSPSTQVGSPRPALGNSQHYGNSCNRRASSSDRRSASPTPLPRSIRRVGRLASSSSIHRKSHTPHSTPYDSPTSHSDEDTISALSSPYLGNIHQSPGHDSYRRSPKKMHSTSMGSISSAASCSINSLNYSSNSSIAGASSSTSLSMASPPMSAPFLGSSLSPVMPSTPGLHTLSGPVGFVNYTPDDRSKILTGVAPSGSSKTKARREKEAAERRRQERDTAIRAIIEAGGDPFALEKDRILY